MALSTVQQRYIQSLPKYLTLCERNYLRTLKLLPKQQDIAEALNLSVRQLQRKLAAQNTSFAQLLQQTRHQLAKEYLANPSRSIVEISLNLGFSDQSNFASAFRRWQGVSPSTYRETYKHC